MDAREFDFASDDPLPQTCQHCEWAERLVIADRQPIVMCKNQTAIREFRVRGGVSLHHPKAVHVKPDYTCRYWEERE